MKSYPQIKSIMWITSPDFALGTRFLDQNLQLLM